MKQGRGDPQKTKQKHLKGKLGKRRGDREDKGGVGNWIKCGGMYRKWNGGLLGEDGEWTIPGGVMGIKRKSVLASFFPYRDSSVLNSLWKEPVEKEVTKILER